MQTGFKRETVTYDHYSNAGNKGDMWQHVVLLSAVRNA
jgi:hypothetical protein